MHARTTRLLLAYDGTGFRGWAAQRDPAIRTVEGSLTDALELVTVDPVTARRWPGAPTRGSTRAGRSRRSTPRRTGRPTAIRDAINGRLAPEVVAIDGVRPPAASTPASRRRAREYRYRIDVGPVPDPFTARVRVAPPVSYPTLAAMRRGRCATWSASTTSRRSAGTRAREGPRCAICSASRSRRRGDRLEIGMRANAFLPPDGPGARGHARRGGGGQGRPRCGAGHPRGAGPCGGASAGPAARAHPGAGQSMAADVRERADFALTARWAAGSWCVGRESRPISTLRTPNT